MGFDPVYVAFGPEKTWVAVSKSGNIKWSSNLPDRVFNMLDKRYNNPTTMESMAMASTMQSTMMSQCRLPTRQDKMNSTMMSTNGQLMSTMSNMCGTVDSSSKAKKMSPIQNLQFGENWYIATFRDGSSKWKGVADDLDKLLDKGEPKFISVSADGGKSAYILEDHKGRLHWNNLPSKMEKLINKTKADVKTASLGGGNMKSWFIAFDDGKFHWGGDDLSEDLDDILSGCEKVKRLFLSSYNHSNFYIEYDGGKADWAGANSFSNVLNADEKMDVRDILYSNNNIKPTFQCGRSIRGVVEDIEDGKCEPNDIPCIRVFKHKHKIYTLDNRRLWCFKEARVQTIPVVWAEKVSREVKERIDDGQVSNSNEMHITSCVTPASKSTPGSTAGFGFGAGRGIPEGCVIDG